MDQFPCLVTGFLTFLLPCALSMIRKVYNVLKIHNYCLTFSRAYVHATENANIYLNIRNKNKVFYQIICLNVDMSSSSLTGKCVLISYDWYDLWFYFNILITHITLIKINKI